MLRILGGAVAGMAGVVWLCADCFAGGPSLGFGGLLLDKEPENDMQVASPVLPLDGTDAKLGFLILGPGDVDFFRVFLGIGEVITVTTMPLGGGPTNPFTDPDTVVAIFDSGGVLMLENDDAGTDFPGMPVRGSALRFRVPSSDLYAVRVRGFTARFAFYGVMISRTGAGIADLAEAEPNDTPTKALLLGMPYCGPVFGYFTLSSGTDVDWFSVDLHAGEAVMMTTTPLQAAGSFSSPDTILTVFDTDQTTVLVEDDDDNAAENGTLVRGSTVRMRAPHDGRYYIRCRSFMEGSSGLYAITASVAPRLNTPCAADLNMDGVVNSSDLGLMLGMWGVCQ